MESKRQAKFARQVQKDMSEILLREGSNLLGMRFVSVTTVRVSPDLGYVKFYLTFMNEKNPDKALNLVRQYTKELRTMLAARIRNSVKKIPEIEFFYDDTMDFVEKMDKLFDDIHSHPTSEKDTSGDYKE
jgi:ribosome-binding factor A